MKRDLQSNFKAVLALAPQLLNVADSPGVGVGEVIDLSGYHSCAIVVLAGEVNAGEWVYTLKESDTSNGVFTAVAASDLQGEATGPDVEAASPALFTGENGVVKFGYIGNKRYIRLDVDAPASPASSPDGGYFGAVALLGNGEQLPIA